jgi:hypothetical protein
MKKVTAFITILFFGFIFISCDEETTGPGDPDPIEEGNIFVQSTPAGAEIWLDDTNTNNVTPDTLTGIEPGTHEITLMLQDYRDTTIAVIVNANQTSSVSVTLTADFSLTKFGPVRIYETAGTTVDQPSGVDLSLGMAFGISGSDNNLVDIYYSTTGTGGEGFLVQSAHLSPDMSRETLFRVGDGTDLDDGEDSPQQTSGTWTNSMSDRESNYVFLYDDDNHYSKIKIVDSGGGVPGEPAWVEVEWWYNSLPDDPRF